MDLPHHLQHNICLLPIHEVSWSRMWGGNKGKVGGATWLTVDRQRQVWSALPVITRRTCNLWLHPTYVTDYRWEVGARWRDDKHGIREGNNRELDGTRRGSDSGHHLANGRPGYTAIQPGYTANGTQGYTENGTQGYIAPTCWKTHCQWG